MPWTHRSFWVGPLIIAGILGLLAVIVSVTRLRAIYKRQFPETRRERLFLASVGFFTAVVVIRGLTIAIHNDIGPFHNVSMRCLARVFALAGELGEIHRFLAGALGNGEFVVGGD